MSLMIKAILTVLFAVMVLLIFCANLYPESPPEKSTTSSTVWEWPRSTPTQQGMDPDKLNELIGLIKKGRKFPRMDSLLIVRNGKLVVEEYFRGYEGNRLHVIQSVTKSFTSALIGIAIHQGKIKGVDEKILGFFPDYKIKNMDERKAALSLKDLLTMRTGTDYHERGYSAPHYQLIRKSKGWDRFYLNRKMIRQPGTKWFYDSGGAILMSALLKARTGKHAEAFAKDVLFSHLDIRDYGWYTNKEGHTHTGGGLELKPRDMAKFGQLYLQKGKWQGKQIVPAQWIEESTRSQLPLHNEKEWVVGYGYLWWIMEPDPNGNGKDRIYGAFGHRAQYIFVVPEHDLVVVVNGDTYTGWEQERPISFLYSHILPAIKR